MDNRCGFVSLKELLEIADILCKFFSKYDWEKNGEPKDIIRLVSELAEPYQPVNKAYAKGMIKDCLQNIKQHSGAKVFVFGGTEENMWVATWVEGMDATDRLALVYLKVC